jgi:hypothetical protein
MALAVKSEVTKTFETAGWSPMDAPEFSKVVADSAAPDRGSQNRQGGIADARQLLLCCSKKAVTFTFCCTARTFLPLSLKPDAKRFRRGMHVN